jgi:ceramide glucosyltransferase
MIAVQLLAAALAAGSLVFCVLAILAARSYLRQPPASCTEPVTILKPLRGMDLGLEGNLRSFFTLHYADFELVFALQDAADPAHAAVEKLCAEYPSVRARIVLTGPPPDGWNNAKCWQLAGAWHAVRHDLVVMSDSDIRVAPEFLDGLDPRFDVATCPYRAVGGPSFWSHTEAIGMNTEFLSGVLTARYLEGVKFAVGPTLYCRRAVIEAIGGWPELQEFLAEDFVIGNRAAERGYRVGLSRQIVEHRIGSEPIGKNFAHRLRWYRSTRRSRPAGYVGQLFTMPLPIAMLLVAVAPGGWPLAAVLMGARLAAGIATLRIVGAQADPISWLVQDLLSFGFWVAGFFGNTIAWRDRRYVLHADGRFTRVS